LLNNSVNWTSCVSLRLSGV